MSDWRKNFHAAGCLSAIFSFITSSLILVLFFTSYAHAAVIYVSKIGNGSAPYAGTETGAYSSWGTAFSKTNPGDTVYIFNGLYAENKNLAASDTDPIFFVGQDSRSTVLTCTGGTVFNVMNTGTAVYHFENLTLWSPAGSAIATWGDTPTITVKNSIVRCSTTYGVYQLNGNLNVDNVTFDTCGDGGAGEAAVYFLNLKNVSIRNSRFVNCNEYGISAGAADTLLITDCVFERSRKDGINNSSNKPREIRRCSFFNNRHHGINVAQGEDTVVISHSLFVDNDSAGVYFNSTEATVLNSTFVDNQDGIYLGVWNGQVLSIRNNIFASNRRAGLYIKTNSNTESFTYNLFDNAVNVYDDPNYDTCNTTAEINAVMGGESNIVAPVYFVNNTSDSLGNYRESGRSPAVDQGDTSDYASEPAPNGSRINLGRYGGTSDAASSNFFATNNAPIASFVQKPQGSYDASRIKVLVDVSDTDGDDAVRMRVEYSTTGSFAGAPSKATILASSLTASHGYPSVDNTREYQIGTPSGWVRTSSGVNRISFDWDIATDLPNLANDTLYLRVIVNDGIDTCVIPPVSQKFTDGVLRVAAGGGKDFTTIASAINLSSDGDTVYVYAGTYAETVQLTNNIALIGEDSRTVLITGGTDAAVVLRADTGFYYLEGFTAIASAAGSFAIRDEPNPWQSPSYVTIRNVSMIGGTFAGFATNTAGTQSGGSTYWIDHCVIRGAATGVDASTAGFGHKLKIDSSTVTNNTSYGVNTNCETLHIANSMIADNGADGLLMQGYLKSVNLFNSIFAHNFSNGIKFAGADTVLIKNCVTHNNGRSGIYSSATSYNIAIRNCFLSANASYGLEDYDWPGVNSMHPSMTYCIFYGNYGAEIVTDSAPLMTLSSNIEVNSPPWVDNCYSDPWASVNDTPYVNNTGDSRGDYRLKSGAIGVDSGAPYDDYSNEPVPNGSRIDIGAFGNTIGATATLPTGSAPNVSIDTQPVQIESGVVAMTARMNDVQHETLSVKIHYSFTGDFAAESRTATIASCTASYGSVQVNNAAPYAISGVPTASDTNILLIRWATLSDSPLCEDTSVRLMIEVTDGVLKCTALSQDFTVDNRNPRELGSLTDSGHSSATVTLGFGAPAVDSTFLRYRVFYSKSASVSEADTEWASSESVLTSRIYAGHSSLAVTGLVGGETYSFIIVAYDSYGNKLSTVKLVKYLPNIVPPVIQSVTLSSTASSYVYAVTPFGLNPVIGDTIWFNNSGSGANQIDTFTITVNDSNEDTVTGSAVFVHIRASDIAVNQDTYVLSYMIPADSGNASMIITVTDTEGLTDSVVFFMLADTSGPSPASLAAPPADSVTASVTVSFSWSASTDTLSGLSGYRLQIDTSPSFAAPLVDSSAGVATSASRTLPANDTYWWRVVATDRVMNSTASDSRILRIDTAAPLVAGSPFLPAAGHVEHDPYVHFYWYPVTDSQSKIMSRRLQVASDAAFSSMVADSTLSDSQVGGAVTLPGYGSYWWRIKATDSAGNTESSAGRTLSYAAAPVALPALETHPFGLIMGIGIYTETQEIAMARTMRAHFYRNNAVFCDSWTGNDWAAKEASNKGMELILTIRANGGAGTPTNFPSDLGTYGTKVGAILDALRPRALVVECEQNSSLFYTGTADSYRLQLDAAVTAAHARGVPVTDGGMVSLMVAGLTWDGYTREGSIAAANSFAARVFTAGEYAYLISETGQAQLATGRQFLAAMSAVDIDYVNCHWYIQDTRAFVEMKAFMQTRIGRRLVVNEMGQKDSEATTVHNLMATAHAESIPFVIWYSSENGASAEPLQNLDASLRPSGESYVAFITSRIDSTAPAAASLTSPAARVDTSGIYHAFSWTNGADTQSGFRECRIQIDTSPSFAAPVTDSSMGTLASASFTLRANDTHYWRVAMYDQANNVSYSETRVIAIDTASPTIILASPADNLDTRSSSLLFSWSSPDGAETFTWRLARDTAFSNVIDSSVDTTASSFTRTLPVEDTLYWRVTGRDRAGNETTTASRRIFFDARAESPAIVSPEHNNYGNDTTPTFVWQIPADSSGIDSFRLEVSASNTFAVLAFSDTRSGVETSVTITPYLPESTYYWRLRSIDRLGNASAWTTTRTLIIDTGVQLAVPPVDAETRTASIRFAWQSPDATNFTFQLSRFINFSVIADSVVDTTATFAVIALPQEDTWYWRVTGRDTAGNRDTTSTRIILLDQSAQQVSLDTPVTGYYTDSARPTLKWTAPSDSVGIDSFLLQISASAGFASIAWQDTLDVLVTQSAPTSDLAEGSSYWRVKAIDRLSNEGAFSETRVVISDRTAPSIPSLSSPSDAAETRVVDIAFTWSVSSDTGSGLYEYRIQVDTSGAFAVLRTDSSAGTYTGCRLTLPGIDTYWWRIVAADSIGNRSYSGSRRIKVDTSVNQFAPVCRASITGKRYLLIGETVSLVGNTSYDTDGNPLTYRWNFSPSSGVRPSDSTSSVTTCSFAAVGLYDLSLRVSDVDSASVSETFQIRVAAASGDLVGGGAGGLAPDGVVNASDLAAMRPHYGRYVGGAGYDQTFDINGDGVINVIDFFILGRYFGM